MPFLIGKTTEDSNVNESTEGLQNMLVKMLGSGGGFDKLFPGVQPDKASMQPYLDLFTMQNARNLGQAKESAGNLTGSGLASAIGQEAGRANTEQGAFLASLFERRRQEDANRAAALFGTALNSQAGGVSRSYQPGLLDYASQAATGLASGGAFNSLFKNG